MTPCRAIRAMCKECCGGSLKAVRTCESTTCPLWPFRMGRNPNRAGIGGKTAAMRGHGLARQHGKKTATLVPDFLEGTEGHP